MTSDLTPEQEQWLDLEPKEMDRMRRHFVQLVSTHLPEIEPRPSMDNIDDFVMYLVGLVVNAKRVNRPNPVPWFTEACAFLLEADMAEGLGIKPASPSQIH